MRCPFRQIAQALCILFGLGHSIENGYQSFCCNAQERGRNQTRNRLELSIDIEVNPMDVAHELLTFNKSRRTIDPSVTFPPYFDDGDFLLCADETTSVLERDLDIVKERDEV